jgi:hypothetical protein
MERTSVRSRSRSRAARGARTASLSAVGFVVACAMLATGGGLASAAAGPPGLPGPPPGAGTGFPLPPAPAQAPLPEASGSPATLPFGTSGPGLLSGSAGLTGRQVKLQIACDAGGGAALTLPALPTAAASQARYTCIRGHATVSFRLDKSAAQQITRSGSVLAAVAFNQGGHTERLSVTVGPRLPAPDFWTSVFGLECGTPTATQAELLAPNFTVTPSTTIDVRPWLAWYTAATGWQWLGTEGPNASRWYRWTGTPDGVAEWHTSSGTVNPWTWGPIAVAPGHGTYVISVLEAIYWYGHPVYVWRYAHSSPGSPYCAFG